jgi:hypothetical protein
VRDLELIPQGKGIVILSTDAEKTNSLSSTALFLINGDSHKRCDSVIMNFDYPFPSDFNDGHGNLRSLSLPEGWYYLYPEVTGTYTKQAPIYKFYVKSGEILYIGNLSLLAGRRIVFSSAKRFRDIDLFLSKNTKITENGIRTRYMEFDSQYSIRNSDGFKIKGAIFGQP